MTSPQPSYNLIGNFTNTPKSGSNHSALIKSPCRRVSSMTLLPKLGDGGAWLIHSSPSLFNFPQVNNVIQFVSPSQRLASVRMEKSVSGVSKIKNGALSASDIQQARDIHQRLVVRMMTSPGDRKGAMYRIEAAFGLSYHCQVNLRHQNRASADFIARLHAAWTCVLEQSVARDMAELLSVSKEAAE